jgi:hypothetical protein
MKLNDLCHATDSFNLLSSVRLSRRLAMMLGGLPESRFAASGYATEFAFRAPFVNYWRAKAELSAQGLIFSKMPSVQQNRMTALACFS